MQRHGKPIPLNHNIQIIGPMSFLQPPFGKKIRGPAGETFASAGRSERGKCLLASSAEAGLDIRVDLRLRAVWRVDDDVVADWGETRS